MVASKGMKMVEQRNESLMSCFLCSGFLSQWLDQTEYLVLAILFMPNVLIALNKCHKNRKISPAVELLSLLLFSFKLRNWWSNPSKGHFVDCNLFSDVILKCKVVLHEAYPIWILLLAFCINMEFKFQGSPLVADVSAGLIMSNQSLVLQRVREDYYGDN